MAPLPAGTAYVCTPPARHFNNKTLHQSRCKLIPAYSEFQGSRNFLRSDEHAARVIAVIRESERVLLLAMFALPKSVAPPKVLLQHIKQIERFILTDDE